MYRRNKAAIGLFVAMAMVIGNDCFAIPRLEAPIALPAEFDDIITIYPDNENNDQRKRFWLVPSTARIVRKPNGNLAYGLVHSGISGFDPDGISALLNVTIQPYINQDTLQKAKKLITDRESNNGATDVSFSYINPSESTCRLMVGGQFVDWNGDQKSVVQGGTVEAGMPFQVKVTNSLDSRALAQAGGSDAAIFGVLYTMKFRGVGNRLKFRIVAKYEQTLTHFKSEVKGSAWFGLVKATAKAEWQKFVGSGAVDLIVEEGTKEEVDKYMDMYAKDMLRTLIEQLASRTGMFARTVQSPGLPDAPGGGGILGWGVSVGGGYAKIEDTSDITAGFDLQFSRDQEIQFGLNFATGGAELASYTKNLTHTSKPFPTADDFKSRVKEEGTCVEQSLRALKKLYDQGLLPEEIYLKQLTEAIEKGCHSKFAHL